MHMARNPSRGMAPLLPTHCSPSQLGKLSDVLHVGLEGHLPDTSGEVDFLSQGELLDESLSLGIGSRPVGTTATIHPW